LKDGEFLLHIDGSYGEGGGQILRYAIALSIFTKKPVEITNIRAKRSKPGLRPQHLTALTCMKTISNAKTHGLAIGSTKLTFTPGDIQPGEYCFDIGTAGSITLVFQACILSAIKTTKPITIRIKGGTDVKWSPSWAYFTNIFLPLIQMMGIKIEARLIKRGYYPKGGGEAFITIYPTKQINHLQLKERCKFNKIKGIINSSNLPIHISKRIKNTIIKKAVNSNIKTSIQKDESISLSPGVGITLWSQSDSAILGSAVIGEKGIPAEKIGENAFKQLIEEINDGANIDTYAIDQLLPYMAIAEGKSICYIRHLSSHTETAMWLLKLFLDVEFQLVKQNKSIMLMVN
jgi:RNA 3'-phosphate cyclase